MATTVNDTRIPPAKRRAAVPAPKVTTEVTADVVQLALRSRFNPLRGITPQILSAQLDNFLLGYVAFAALTWEAIERRDDVLRNVISKRKKAVAKLQRESLQIERSPEAELHAEALDEFYNNLTAVNALDENERGGFPLLVRQMMDAMGKYYAVHEIVWQPGEVLTAEFRFTPLWFFENRTGRLRFLRVPLGGSDGEPLDDGGWMITKGDGLMEACSIAYMFKNLPLKDWLAYSDKFGTPGVLGQTDAAKGSDAGNSLREAVTQFGQNWSGVIYGANGSIKDPIQLVTVKGEGALPFPPLIERMDRAMAAIWRGSDLSTMSADTKGASVQDGEGDILLEDDAAMITETLNYGVDRWVIWQKFGMGVRPLAKSKVVVPERENVDVDLKIDELLLKAGARLGENERMSYYGRPKIDPKDTPLHSPAAVTENVTATDPDAPQTGDLPNERAPRRSPPQPPDPPTLGKLYALARDLFPMATAKDMQPLRTALEKVLHGDDAGFLQRASALYEAMPDMANEIITAHGSADTLYQILSAAAASGISNH